MNGNHYYCRLLSVAFTFILSLSASWALPVDKEQALEKAQQFYNNRGQMSKARKLKQVPHAVNVSTAMESDRFYVFNAGEREGFVIISGDDRTQPVLGYADEGSFSVDNMPENMKSWLEGYVDQIRYLQESSEGAYSLSTPAVRAEVPPLLYSKWGQDHPYNMHCPVFFDESKYGKSVTGCLATSMAQVLYYYKYPSQTKTTIPGYTCWTNHSEYLNSSSPQYITVPEVPVTTFDWDNMLDTYNGTENNTQMNAVSRLMQACGAALEMDYGIDNTGGSSANYSRFKLAFTTYFNYDRSMQHKQRGDFTSSEWDAMVYSELAACRPVIYNGQTLNGGHSFVVDGFDGHGYYHVNWGWSGIYNGYFLLDILTPADNSGIGAGMGGYNAMQNIVVGIRPYRGGSNPSDDVMTTDSIMIKSSKTLTRSSSSSNFNNVEVAASFWNRIGYTATFDKGYGVYDANGNLKSVYTLKTNATHQHTWGTRCYRNALKFNFGANLANGKYRIMPVSKLSSSSQWRPNSGANTYYFLATINGNSLKLSYPTESMTASLTLTNSPEANGPADMQITIGNNGADYKGNVMLSTTADVDDYIYWNQLEMEGGEQLTKTARVKFSKKGSYVVQLFLDDGKVLAQTTVQVADSKTQSLKCTYDVTNGDNSARVINSNTMELDITYTNNGSNKYDNDVTVYLIKKKEDGSEQYIINAARTDRLTLDKDSKVTRSYSFSGLEDGGVYFARMFYTSAGESKYYSNSYVYTVHNTAPAVKVAYAEVNNGTLTFYYDTKKGSRPGKTYLLNSGIEHPAWAVDSMTIRQARIDASFADYCPISTAHWFRHQVNLTNIQGMENLNTSATTTMQSMFYECYNLTSVNVSGFKTNNVTNMGWMFYECNSLTSLNLKNFDTSKVTNMQAMFYNCYSLKSIDISGFKTDNVNSMGWMFYKCNSLTSLDLSNFNTSKVTNMQSMFYNCDALTNIDISGFKTDNVTSMGWMFFGCKSLKSVDVSKFNTSKVTIMNNLFTECEKLTSLDLRNFNTANVTTMDRMFYGCTALTQLNVSSFNTANVTDMHAMFYNCENLTAVDLSNFQTPKVTDMAFMFRGCSKLKQLDLRGFDTSNVTVMNVMFWSCSSLTTIYCTKSWNTSKVTNSEIMFQNCNSLIGGNGTRYNSNYVDKSYARIDGESSKPGYFTYKAASKKGDVNGDGSVDVADIGAIIDVMAKGGSNTAADVNGDGVVDVADIGTVIDIMAANARQLLRFAPPA